jgi:predicted nucleotidyltransferase
MSDEFDKATILRTEIGSTGHGITHGSNDIDEIAVFIPSPSDILGLHPTETYVWNDRCRYMTCTLR